MRVLFVVPDNGSYTHILPLGPAYLTAALEEAGVAVELYQQDLHHWPGTHLQRHIERTEPDVVALGFIGGYWQHAKAIEIGNAVNAARNRSKLRFVLGGHGPSPVPEYFKRLLCADEVIVGEGERALVEYVTRGAVSADHVLPPVDDLPLPAWRRFPMEYYRLVRFPRCKPMDFVAPVLSGRGCPFRCSFCYRMEAGYRPRSVAAIVEEVRQFQRDYGITYVVFLDELLMVSPERAVEISEALMPLGVRWYCQGRINYAKRGVLEVMARAGCVFINYGIESLDNVVLRGMNKALRAEWVEPAIKATLAAGISPGLNFIWGFPDDTAEALGLAVKFLLRYSDHAQLRTIRPVTPYPGSDLYEVCLRSGLLSGPEEFYERHTNSDLVAVNMTRYRDEQVYGMLSDANALLLSAYYRDAEHRARQECRRLYRERDASFRGFRQI